MILWNKDNTKLSFFFFLIIFLSFEIFASNKNCKDIQEYEGFYVLKYTFVKFSGKCSVYDDKGSLIEQRSFKNGEKNGKFITFKNKKKIEVYNMKNNELDGLFESYKNEKLIRRINYVDGELINCEISLAEIMSKEKELISIQKQYSDQKHNDKLKKKIISINRSLLNDKETCQIKEIIE